MVSLAELATTAAACSCLLLHVNAQRLLPSRHRSLVVDDIIRDDNDGDDASSRELRAAAAKPADDLVRELPGLDPSAQITQHAGRIALRSGERNQIFYWHFPAATAPETAPLVVWLNGGPGCSSMQGLFLYVVLLRWLGGSIS